MLLKAQKAFRSCTEKLLSSVDIENKRIVFDSEILAEVGLFED